MSPVRLAIDIGGTFTDVVLERGRERHTTKVLTTHGAPADGVFAGLEAVLDRAGALPAELTVVIHGTTLATNALIERRGAKTALITTAGHRDALEMAYENRFEQYDVNIDRPRPLVPRELRLTVDERISATGAVLRPFDPESLLELLPVLDAERVESIAIGLLHAYVNPAHEIEIARLLAEHRPQLSVTLASEVCPEIREFERLSTACANAYVKPLMQRYLTDLAARLEAAGSTCPLLMMTSGGGLTTLETAARFPIRLVESGPAGGALLAAELSRDLDEPAVLSFDMGGTTAKICLIDDGQPQQSRAFEVDRTYRFRRGSGLPVRIPVIEMVEIGAGGGSIAHIDRLGRIAVGPESAGSEPGPACYGRGGQKATVTDADLMLGRLDPEGFAGGRMRLDPDAARAAIDTQIAQPSDLEPLMAAFGISEVVDENMAAAARAHAAEWGREARGRTLIAFGGAAPLHAARLAEKLHIERIIVPEAAGVGSAVGFLRAPISFEVVRSRYQRLSAFDPEAINAVMAEMYRESLEVVRGASDAPINQTRNAFMRYLGQGYEIAVPLPVRDLEGRDRDTLQAAFDAAYRRLYGRTIAHLDVEILSFTLTLSARAEHPKASEAALGGSAPAEATACALFDPSSETMLPARVLSRDEVGSEPIDGPLLVREAQTTTVVPRGFRCRRVFGRHLALEHCP